MKYTILESESALGLSEIVTDAFTKEWRPIGGPFIVPRGTCNGEQVSVYSQALIFIDPEPEPEPRTKEQMVQQAMADLISKDPEMQHPDPQVN